MADYPIHEFDVLVVGAGGAGLRAAIEAAEQTGLPCMVHHAVSNIPLDDVLGALRPRGVPIVAFTDNEQEFRQLLLPWGVEPFLMPFSDDP